MQVCSPLIVCSLLQSQTSLSACHSISACHSLRVAIRAELEYDNGWLWV